MHPSTILTTFALRLTRSFARPLFALGQLLLMMLWLLPSPLVWAQTGTVPQAAAQAQPEAQARELERRLNFPRSNSFSSQRSEPATRELVLG